MRSARNSPRPRDGFDYLVNAAGILRVKPIIEVTVEDWRTIQTVNAESVFFLCQLIGARLNPGGAVVNLSSSSAKLATSVDVAPYAASKADDPLDHPLLRLCARRPSRARQRDLPGIVETEMQERFLEGVSAKARDVAGRARC